MRSRMHSSTCRSSRQRMESSRRTHLPVSSCRPFNHQDPVSAMPRAIYSRDIFRYDQAEIREVDGKNGRRCHSSSRLIDSLVIKRQDSFCAVHFAYRKLVIFVLVVTANAITVLVITLTKIIVTSVVTEIITIRYFW